MISSHIEALWNNLHPTHQNQTSNPSTPPQVLVLLYLSAGMSFAKNMASVISCKTWRSYRVQDHQGKKKGNEKKSRYLKKERKKLTTILAVSLVLGFLQGFSAQERRNTNSLPTKNDLRGFSSARTTALGTRRHHPNQKRSTALWTRDSISIIQPQEQKPQRWTNNNDNTGRRRSKQEMGAETHPWRRRGEKKKYHKAMEAAAGLIVQCGGEIIDGRRRSSWWLCFLVVSSPPPFALFWSFYFLTWELRLEDGKKQEQSSWEEQKMAEASTFSLLQFPLQQSRSDFYIKFGFWKSDLEKFCCRRLQKLFCESLSFAKCTPALRGPGVYRGDKCSKALKPSHKVQKSPWNKEKSQLDPWRVQALGLNWKLKSLVEVHLKLGILRHFRRNFTVKGSILMVLCYLSFM